MAICMDGSKPAGAWSQARQMVINLAPITVFSTHIKKKNQPISLKKILVEKVKIINSITSWPWVHVFLVLCEHVEKTFNLLLQNSQVQSLSPEKELGPLSESSAELVVFFIKHHFSLKEQQTNYGFFDMGIWQKFSQKQAKGACHLEKNNGLICC